MRILSNIKLYFTEELKGVLPDTLKPLLKLLNPYPFQDNIQQFAS